MNKPLKTVCSMTALAVSLGCSAAYAATSHKTDAVHTVVQTAEPFKASVLASGLNTPWDMVWGPDDYIWVTERKAKSISRVNPKTGEKQVLVTLDKAFAGPQHEGVLGLALSPSFMQKGGDNYVYTAYTYMDGENEHAKIVRLEYDQKAHSLGNETTIIEGFPAGHDHNGGRLRFGPDGKLYYTLGEQGHNQGGNVCKPIESQRIPTTDELTGKDYVSYAGKVLRINTDGSIPADNPVIKGIKSHIYTYGHRNPQGLVFVGDVLYSSEQGPSSDDELNILEPGGNYGWPHVAGFKDNQGYVYANYSGAPNCADVKFDPNHIQAGVPVQKETDWKADDFKPPIKTFFTVKEGYAYNDSSCGEMSYMCWPTIAPGSVAYYPADGAIKSWRNSVIISSMKNGALYRMPLTADKKDVQGDVSKDFRSTNRYRMVLVSPDTRKIYVATDNDVGNVMDANNKPTNQFSNPGSILVFEYTGK